MQWRSRSATHRSGVLERAAICYKVVCVSNYNAANIAAISGCSHPHHRSHFRSVSHRKRVCSRIRRNGTR
jgi:hypothetical protein